MYEASCSSTSPAWQSVSKCLIGGSAAVFSKTTTAPIDRVKLILQLQNNGKGHSTMQYVGVRDCFAKVTAEQGILSLWRGNGAGVARCFPNHALNFALRDIFRNSLLSNVDRKTEFTKFITGTLASGALGGATSLLILFPFDFARTRLAVDSKRDGSKQYKGMVDCLVKIHRIDGVRGLYRGFAASLQFIAVSRAVFFGFFDTIRTGCKDPKQLNFIATWLLAQACLMSSGVLCYPLDTVRRRLMMDSGRQVKLYKGISDCWKSVYLLDGLPGFYRGCLANSMRSTGGALIITLYYECCKYM